jgi:LPXTG-motif cell wall-anchored protein
VSRTQSQLEHSRRDVGSLLMTRFGTLALLVFAVLAIAPAAGAQARDPFEPLVTEGSSTGDTSAAGSVAGAGTGTGEGATGTTSAFTAPTTRAETLPNTGGDPSSWLVVASVLIALGGAALFASRDPAAPRSSSSQPALER